MKKRKNKNRRPKAVYFHDLDIVRSAACAGVLLYHLGLLRGGYLAVCVFFMLSGFLSATSALKQERFSVRAYYLKRLKQIYLPLAAVTLITVFTVSLFPDIIWLNLKPETASVLLGYNNFWQIAASTDYFARHISSPFIHFWYAAIQLQLDALFPAVFILLSKLREKKGKRAFYCALSAAAILSMFCMEVLFSKGEMMRAYYGTFARAHAYLVGILFGLLLNERERSGKKGKLKTGDRQTLFWLLMTVWMILMLFCGDGSAFWVLPVTALLGLGILWAGTGSRAKKDHDRVFRILSGLSYEIYLVQYPVIFLIQELTGQVMSGETMLSSGGCILAAALTVVLAVLLKKAEDFDIKNLSKKKALSAVCFCLTVILSLAGTAVFASAEDHTLEMKELEAQLGEIEAEMLRRQEEVQQRRQQEEADWQEMLDSFSDGEESLREAVRQLPVVGIGDSVMMGALPALYEQFPNGYFDTGTSRTSYVADGIISSIENRGLLNDVVIFNFGANGEGPERIRENIVDRLSGKKVFWITNTNRHMLWVNDSVKSLAERKNNLRIVDWYERSRGHEEYFVADNIHLTSSGQKAFAQAVFDEVCEAYREEWQEKVDAAIAEHEQQQLRKTVFYGNDLLTGVYPFLDDFLKDAEISVMTGNVSDLLDTVRLSAESGELAHRVVFVFDRSIHLTEEHYRELAEICSGHEVFAVDSEGNATQTEGVSMISMEDMDRRSDLYMPDRMHLSESGNEELAGRISDALAD